MPSSSRKNNCKEHPTVQVQNCPVEFFSTGNGRWVGGIIHSNEVRPNVNLHNHPVERSLSHKLPSMVTTDIDKTLEDNPYLTTQQLASGHGLGYRPGSVQLAGTSYSRLDYIRKKSLKESGLSSKGDCRYGENHKVDQDCFQEGSTVTICTTWTPLHEAILLPVAHISLL